MRRRVGKERFPLSRRIAGIKRLCKEERRLRYYLEKRDSIPDSITAKLRNATGRSRETAPNLSRVFSDGTILFAMDGELTVWKIDPLAEYFPKQFVGGVMTS